MSNIATGIPSTLTAEYNLGAIYSSKRLTGGISNDVYFIETTNQKYVYKKYRYPSPQIQEEQKFLQFLESNSFPVPHVIAKPSNSSSQMSKIDILYKFVDGDCPAEPNTLTDSQLRESGRTLGVYHTLVDNLSDPLVALNSTITPVNPRNLFTKRIDFDHFFQQTDVIALWNAVQTKITAKKVLNPIDEQILQVAPVMLRSIRSVDQQYINALIRNTPRVLAHGDYQGTNLIFNTKQIQAVIDWEMRGTMSRSWEVLYALTVMCKINNTENFNTPLDLQRAKIFLDAYREKHILTDTEIEAIPLMGYITSLSTPYLLQAHYIKNNTSLDKFFPKHVDDWFWWHKNYQHISEAIL